MYIVVLSLVLRIMVIGKEILIIVVMTVNELLMPMMEEDKHMMMNIVANKNLNHVRDNLWAYTQEHSKLG